VPMSMRTSMRWAPSCRLLTVTEERFACHGYFLAKLRTVPAAGFHQGFSLRPQLERLISCQGRIGCQRDMISLRMLA
jgi:hypothetical protein